ncbi:FAD binding domain-containing protein [Jaminaea rosea]|uniref:FAD binding domain-containing protein n=1 Tax=Jaminaea rosea TaxID=1569628 RepID=A0A316UZU6_9BASI|nr:FAD binding domain-containing protein [Jaminaea rosea]PWN30827.1 FAD binding domain-containing protein [Jaminaea rosea]
MTSLNGHANGSTSTLINGDAASREPVIIVGAGLAGLVAAYEITKAGQKVIFVEQENSANLGGQAFWSLGGIFLVDSVEQRRFGIRDSLELARRDWYNSAQWDRLDDEDFWAKKWADAYLEFAAGPKRQYLRDLGVGYLPTTGWAERGASVATGHGNSVPRFHLTWGTGPAIVKAFADPVLEAQKKGLVEFRWRHQVDAISLDSAGRAVGVAGIVLEPSDHLDRGVQSSRKAVGDFEITGRAVLVSSGGIGGNVPLVKKLWPKERFHNYTPEHWVVGVPAHVDGRMISISEKAGARTVNNDRMWHYTEGLKNWNSIWPNHGIRVITGPSSLWLDAKGKRLPPPCFPSADTLSTLRYICSTGYDHTWLILNKSIALKEFALSGSEQNADFTSKSLVGVLKRVIWGSQHIHDFQQKGEDWVTADNVESLVEGMNKIVKRDGRGPEVELEQIREELETRDAQMDHPYSKDTQVMLIRNAKSYKGDVRCCKPHKIGDPKWGPLIAIRLNLITRKTLGGIQTNLESQVMKEDGTVLPGLYAAGEVAGFGGGGVHGLNALEGTFLGGCIFSGRAAGMSLAGEGDAKAATQV